MARPKEKPDYEVRANQSTTLLPPEGLPDASHLMSWGGGQDPQASYLPGTEPAYQSNPTVFPAGDGTLMQMEPGLAAAYARDTGEYRQFDSPEEAAAYAENGLIDHSPESLANVAAYRRSGADIANTLDVGPQMKLRDELIRRGYDPAKATTFARVASRLDELGYDTFVGPNAGMRTKSQAKENLKKGVSSTLKSKHLTGDAIDLRDKKIFARGPDAESIKYASELGRIAKEEGLEWGGDWFKKGGKPASWSNGIGWDPHHIQTASSKAADAAVNAAMQEQSSKLVESVMRPVEPHDASTARPLRDTMGALQSLADLGYEDEVYEYMTTSQEPQ